MEDEYKVWMTDRELSELRRVAANHRDDLIIQSGGYVVPRAFEIPQIRPKHVKRTEDGEHYQRRVPEGKDTTVAKEAIPDESVHDVFARSVFVLPEVFEDVVAGVRVKHIVAFIFVFPELG